MITLIIIIVIILFIFAYKQYNTPHVQDKQYYEHNSDLMETHSFSRLPETSELHFLESASTELQDFIYHNRQVHIRMLDGTTFDNMLENITVRYHTPDKCRDISMITIEADGKKIDINHNERALTKNDWWIIFCIFSHSSRVYNLDGFLQAHEYHQKTEEEKKNIAKQDIAISVTKAAFKILTKL